MARILLGNGYVDAQLSLQRTMKVPLTTRDIEASSYDTVFLITELSDAMRRGVEYWSLAGSPLDSLNDVLEALLHDGEIAFDDDRALAPIGH